LVLLLLTMLGMMLSWVQWRVALLLLVMLQARSSPSHCQVGAAAA
jgi:hypothetical protein